MTAARYDDVADFYAGSFDDPDDPAARALLELLGPVGGLRVLDLACGHGRITRVLHERGAATTGVDLSGALLAKAVALGPPDITYVHADAADPGLLPGEPFDAVVCSFALSDIDDLGGALGTVAAALCPGGIFAFSLLHPCFPGAGPVSGAWSGSYHDEGWWRADGALSSLRRRVGANHRTLATYVNALARHGLRIEEMREPRAPESWARGDRAEAARFPLFLVVRCRKG
jgi:SAM-dependent methyltransferase